MGDTNESRVTMAAGLGDAMQVSVVLTFEEAHPDF
jgi:hypothetical protein